MTKINYSTKSLFLKLLFLVFFANTIAAQTTTWNGSAWNNGSPDNTKDAVFTGNYLSGGNLSAKSVSVSNNAQVTLAPGHTLTVENNIDVTTGSNLILENNAGLVQINAVAGNTGNVNIKRNATPMVQHDYTYWSSPVANQTLFNFSPATANDRYFSFNTTTNSWVMENPANTMQPGKGYAIMAPKTYTSTPQIFNGEFIGVPNNGDISTVVVAYDPGLLNYNLIANPYPSAISVATLIDNTTLGTLYFWTHNSAIANGVFTTNDYAIRTRNSGIQAISGGAIPSGYVAAGQGFFASSSSTGTITFRNSMRVAGNNSQFYKNTQQSLLDPQFYYVWLNMTNSGGAFKQIAFGYEEGATNGYDFGTDAAAAPGTYISFYSLIGSTAYAIQGRAFPWNVYDQIPLGYSTTIVGPFDITLDHNDPFFDAQFVYLEDMQLGLFHDLRAAPYTFNTAIGTFNSRFKIHYINPLLSDEEYSLDTNAVMVHSENNVISVNSKSQNIQSIQIYDLLGKLVYEKDNLNQNQHSITYLTATRQPLIIKTVLENNQTVVKKLIY